MNLTLAQGAEHIAPQRLKAIVDTINKQRGAFRGVAAIKSVCDSIDSRFIPGFTDWYCNDSMSHINMDDYSVEEKYDGYSYLNIEGRFFSKRLSQAKGSEGTPVEKTGHMPHIANILKDVYNATGCDLHGEIYIPGGISDNVTKILGCTEDEALNRQRQLLSVNGHSSVLHYRLIDIRAINGHSLINEPHYIRHAIMEYLYYMYIKPLDEYGYIQLAEVLYGDPREHFKRIVLSGGEGIIIKRENALYIPGKKPTANWIKGKKKITYDVVMMGLNAGTGKNAGLFGSIEFGHYINGKLTKCGNCSSGLADEMRQYIYDNADRLIADKQVFEIEAIQESVKSFRNAVFLRLRDDKDASECLPINVRIKEDLI